MPKKLTSSEQAGTAIMLALLALGYWAFFTNNQTAWIIIGSIVALGALVGWKGC